MKFRWPILPKHGIELIVNGDAYDLLQRTFRIERPGQQTASVFRRTWLRLPLVVRRVLLKHWRLSRRPLYVFLTNREGDDYAGMCVDRGCTIFLHPVFSEASVKQIDELANTIAHELAHAYRIAVDAMVNDVETEERQVNALAESWGFPQRPFSRRAYRKALRRERQIRAAFATEEAKTKKGGARRDGK